MPAILLRLYCLDSTASQQRLHPILFPLTYLVVMSSRYLVMHERGSGKFVHIQIRRKVPKIRIKDRVFLTKHGNFIAHLVLFGIYT